MLYYNHLQTANEGDTRPFIRFIADCADRTLDVYLWATEEHLPEIEQENPINGFSQEENDDEFDISQNNKLSESHSMDCHDDLQDSCLEKQSYIIDTKDKILQRSDKIVYAGDSWLHGYDHNLDKKEHVQFEHYKSNIPKNKVKKNIRFHFDNDDDNFVSRGR